MVLGAGHHVEGAAHLEVAPLVVQVVHLARVGEAPVLPVQDDGVALHAGPEAAADVDELVRDLVALGVADEIVEAVVGGVGPARGGDQIDGHAAAGDMVQGGHVAGHVVGVHVGGGVGDAEADVLGGPGHDRDQWAHVVTWPLDAPADGGVHGALPGVGDAHAITEEDHVDGAALDGAGDVLPDLGLGVVGVAHPGAGVPPGAIRMGEREVYSQGHRGGHDGLPLARSPEHSRG